MAKARKSSNGQTNKSQAIREMYARNPQAKVSEIVSALGEKGIDVKPSLVYIVKGKMSQLTYHKKKRAARISAATQKTGSSDPIALVVQVKEIAKKAGGMENLKRLVMVLAD